MAIDLSKVHEFLGQVVKSNGRQQPILPGFDDNPIFFDQQEEVSPFNDKKLTELYNRYIDKNDGGDTDSEAKELMLSIFALDAQDGKFDLKNGNKDLLNNSGLCAPGEISDLYKDLLKPEQHKTIGNVMKDPQNLERTGLLPEALLKLLLAFLTDKNTSKTYNDYMKTAKANNNYLGEKPSYIPQLGKYGFAKGLNNADTPINSQFNNSLQGKTINVDGQQMNLKEAIKQVASEEGIDSNLLAAVMGTESSGNPGAVSNKGAQGLMQIMGPTAGDLAGTYGTKDNPVNYSKADILNKNLPIANLRAGARYLKQLLKRYHGDVRLALAAYNAGMGAVDRAGGVPNIPETQNYVASILNATA